jgi:hypothetical protein
MRRTADRDGGEGEERKYELFHLLKPLCRW